MIPSPPNLCISLAAPKPLHSAPLIKLHTDLSLALALTSLAAVFNVARPSSLRLVPAVWSTFHYQLYSRFAEQFNRLALRVHYLGLLGPSKAPLGAEKRPLRPCLSGPHRT